ncbi:NAD-dependent epimerase/dehydratase family protein [Paraburkholderia sp. T12-10]|nr:NAD-dependent epimerase/dehydratase family protein [Paraburkholderia sp. T12-10]
MIGGKMRAILSGDIADIVAHALPWSKLSGRRVVVTGAGGFLGGYLVRTLLALHAAGIVERPVEVIAMVRDAKRSRERFAGLDRDAAFSLYEWDLSRVDVPDVQDCGFVMHAASLASPRFYGTDPVGTLMPNTTGTAALLEMLRRSRCPQGFLFVSSSEVYGAVANSTGLDETDYGIVDPASVRACYAESKRMGEAMCVAWHHQHGLPTFIVRPFHTYGPGLKEDDGRVFADFVFNVLRGEDIAMNSDGSARRAFCYASDAVSGFFHVLLQGKPALPYNVGNPAGELSVLELAELLITLAPRAGIKVQRQMPRAAAGYMASPYSQLIPDVRRLIELGWRPRIEPRVGFSRMIEAYQA